MCGLFKGGGDQYFQFKTAFKNVETSDLRILFYMYLLKTII